MNKNQKFNKVVKYIAWKALGAFVFVAVAGTSIWALAAFTEPTDTPSNSVQDWAKNIMGANNSDNAFDSGDVMANSDGSLVERLEDLKDNQGQQGVTAVYNYTGYKTWTQAISYCEDLSSAPSFSLNHLDSNITTSYDDWKLPTVDEMKSIQSTYPNAFYASASYHWTAGETSSTYAYMYQPSSEALHNYAKTYSSVYVSCVR